MLHTCKCCAHNLVRVEVIQRGFQHNILLEIVALESLGLEFKKNACAIISISLRQAIHWNLTRPTYLCINVLHILFGTSVLYVVRLRRLLCFFVCFPGVILLIKVVFKIKPVVCLGLVAF